MGEVTSAEGLGAARLRKKGTMKLSRSLWTLGIALVGLIVLLTPAPAFAQSCALCYGMCCGLCCAHARYTAARAVACNAP